MPLSLTAQEFIDREKTWTWSWLVKAGLHWACMTKVEMRAAGTATHTGRRPKGLSQAEAVSSGEKQRDSAQGGSGGFLGKQGPPWCDHQGLTSVAGQRFWWEGRASYKVECSLHLPFCHIPFFLTSSLLFLLEGENRRCSARLLWPEKSHPTLGLGFLLGTITEQ